MSRAPRTGLSNAWRRPASSSTRSLTTQAILHIGHLQSVDQWLDVPIHHGLQVVRGEPDAVIGHAALRKVVRPNLGGSIAGPHLGLPHAGALGLLLRDAQIEQPRAKNLHRFRAILDLRPLILLAAHNPGGKMRDADRGISRVHTLAARTRRPEYIDAEILVLDLHVDVFGLGEHRD